MANEERIDNLISDKALDSFDQLKAKVDVNIDGFEKLLASAVRLNQALGSAGGFKDIIAANDKLAQTEKDLIKQVTDLQAAYNNLAAQQTATSKGQAANAAGAQQTAIAIKGETDALSQNIKTQIEYQQRIKQITNEINDTKKAYIDGKVSLDQYKAQTIALSKEQAQLKSTLTNLSSTIKAQIKDEQTAAGSVEQLRAKLLLLQKAYDNLNKGQRSSDIGKDIKSQLNGVNDELSKLEQGTGRFQRNVGNYKDAFGSVSASLGPLAAALVGLGSIKELFTDIIDEAEHAEANTSRFQNTLKNLGKSDAFDRLSDEANRLAKAYGYLDNDDVIDTFNKLTIYGKLTENQIKQLTPVIIDFAAQQRISLSEATDVFTKALEGSGKALKTYGIDIKDGTNVTERFGILMTDLKGKVDGAGLAFGQTLAGQVAISKQSLKDLEEEVGGTLLPIFDKLKIVALAGLQGIIQGVEQLAFNIKTLYRSIFDRDALADDISKAGILQQINQANAFAQSYIAGIRDKSTAGLQKELETSKQILVTDKQYAEQIAKTNGATKEQIKLRNQAYLNSQAIVAGLETEIKLSKEKIKVADDDKSTTKLKTFDSKQDDDVAKHYIELQKQVSEGLDVELNNRLGLRQDAYSKEYNLLIAATERERKVALDKQNDVLNGKSNNNEKINAVREYNAAIETINNKFDADQTLQQLAFEEDYDKILATARVKRLADEKEFNKQFVDAQLAAQAAKIAAIDQTNQIAQSVNAEAKDILLKNLDENRVVDLDNKEKQKQEDEDYAHARLKIETDFLTDSLQNNITYYEKLLEIKMAATADTPEEKAAQAKEITKLQAQIAALKAQLAAARKAKSADDQKSADEDFGRLIETFNKITKVANAFTDTIGGAINASITAQKNQLQEQSDQIDKNAAAEIAAVTNSGDAEEKKAARIAIINARVQAQKDAIDRRQRALDQQKAVFDKAKAIFDIILGTAVAIAKATTPFEKIFNAVSGAAQLAIAIATPIPKYEYGTTDAKGGLALVGDGYRSELVQNRDGSMWVTPSVPTVMNVEKGAIVYPDALAAMERGIGGGAVQSVRDSGGKSEVIGGKLDSIERAIRNKQEWKVTVKKDGWEKIKKGPNGSTHYL